MDKLETTMTCEECGDVLTIAANGNVEDCCCGSVKGLNIYGRRQRGRRNKYNNRHVRLDGHTFDSQAEAEYYKYVLKPLAEAGDIRDLQMHPVYVLQASFVDMEGKEWPAVTYEADFSFWETRFVVVDVKGVETALFKVKAALFRKRFPYFDFRVVKV